MIRAAGELLRALALFVAAVILCAPLSTPLGVMAAASAAGLGTLTGAAMSRTRLRPLPFLGLLGLALLAGTSFARFLVGGPLLASMVGSRAALTLAEAVTWFSVVYPVATALRFLSSRWPALTLLEVMAVGAALASSLAAHREGMVHRPLAIADPVWSRGGDPVIVFLIIGGLGSLVLASLLLSENRKRRLPLHLAGLVVLAVLLTLIVRLTGIPQPKAAGDLGLTGEPRGGRGGEAEQGESRRAGSNEDLPFRDEYRREGGQAPVAVVLLHDDYSPPSGVYYFRQAAFSQFNGIRLVEATREDVDEDVALAFPEKRREIPGAPPVSDQRKPLETTVGLLADHVKPFALDSPASFWPTPNPDPLRFRRAYSVLSRVPTLPYPEMLGRKPGRPGWSEEQWSHYTDFPAGDPRYAELAQRIVADLKPEYRSDPLARAVAVKAYLEKNGTYSRRSRHAGAEDPTGHFLFGDMTGYCVHFAHAEAFLLRSLGVPARVAGGYAVEEASRAGGSAIMIRGANAHAWPEVFLDGVGWVVVDVAPERTLDTPDAPADPQLQQMLGQMLRKKPGSTGEAEGARPRLSFREMAAGAGWLLLAALLSVYALKLYRALAPRFVSGEQVSRVAYRAALDRLSESAPRRRFGETREAYAERMSALSPSFVPLTWGHLGRALGTRRPGDPEQLRRLAGAVGPELRARVPAWRWGLGLANPLSIFLSR